VRIFFFVVPITRLTKFSYLLQHHSDHFVDAWDARSRLATLCTSFLTFPCFSPFLDPTDIQRSVLQGDYAFEEYCVLNWIHHAKAVRSRGTMLHDNVTRLDGPILSLYRHYLQQFPTLTSESNIGAATMDKTAVSRALTACQKANDLVDDVRLNESDPGKAFTFHHIRSSPC